MNHSIFYETELKTIQDEYRIIVQHGFDILNLNYFSPDKCLWFVDVVSGFWLERKNLTSYILDRITEHNDCFILSAAINLQVNRNNHYPYRAVGDYQFLYDPFLKLEGLLRATAGSVNTDELQSQFRYVMSDTLNILNRYPYDFFFIGGLDQTSKDQKIETIHQGYDNFLKQLFNEEDASVLPDKFSTYELIEKQLAEAADIILFNDSDDDCLLLGARVERFLTVQRGLSSKFTSGSEYERFSLALFCLYSQAVDTMLTCLAAGMYPYYRSQIPVRYFYLLLQGYSEDPIHLEFIGKTNAAYFLGHGIDCLDIEKIPFSQYRAYVTNEQPYVRLIRDLSLDGAGTMKYQPSDISKVIATIIEKIKSDLDL